MASAPMNHAILHEYPYPIAKCYERLVGARDLNERWNLSRYLVEVTLKYCACLAVAQYLAGPQRDDKTNAALTCLDRPSLGHWLNILLRCEQFNQAVGTSFIPQGLLAGKSASEHMANACASLGDSRERVAGTIPRVSPSRFFEIYIAYRNRTAGHGSPSKDHISGTTPLLEAATIDLLDAFAFLSDVQLVHLSEIRFERHTCIHSLTRLMGTSQVAIADYVTDVSGALIGHDRKVFLCEPGGTKPIVSLHPLAIHARDELYLLHHSDLRRNVDYICHHTGDIYSADRIFEDFKDALGAFVGREAVGVHSCDPETVYEESVRMSLIDGVLSEEESRFLADLRNRLSIDEAAGAIIESRVRGEAHFVSPATRSGERSCSEAATPAVVTARSADSGIDVAKSAQERALAPKLLFLSYASIGNSFWADFVSRLVAQAHKREWVLSMLGPDPGRDHDASAMSALVGEIDSLLVRHQADVLMVVPFPSVTFSSLLRKRIKQFKVPVVSIDSTLALDDSEGDDDAPSPPAVVIDNYKGGELAAELLLARNSRRVAAPRYLVMPGLDNADHSIARVQGFQDRLHREIADARVRALPEGRFERKRAMAIFRDFIEDADLDRYEGIFCCNDDMALGVYAAVCNWFKSGGKHSGFAIAGFNNTVEFRSVQAADPYECLVGSVDQSIGEYVRTVCEVAESLAAGKRVEGTMLIAPRIVAGE